MEWVAKLEAKTGWGDVGTIEVDGLERRVVGARPSFGGYRPS